MTETTSGVPTLTTSTGEPRITENMNTAGLDTAHQAGPAGSGEAGDSSLLGSRGVQLAIAALVGLLIGRTIGRRRRD